MFNPQHSYTLEEYKKLVETFPNRKYEYIHGYIRMMSHGSPAHTQIALNIGTALNNALRESECNVYGSDATVRLSESVSYIPDSVVSRDPHDWTRKDALESPNVVVEVLSPYTEKIDRNEKLVAYQRYPTVLEILLVDSRKRSVEHYHRVNQYQWLVSYYTNEDDIVDLSNIDVVLPLREIYFKVYLELEEGEISLELRIN